MDSDEEIFAAALALPSAARANFLERACAGDDGRRARIEALLRGHEAAGLFLEHPPVSAGAFDRRQAPLDRIGRYQLLERLGEGGCGVVYVAEQQQPIRRRVALKIIKAGMDTAAVIARFEAERQALALMDHPHIAKVFDAGESDTGRPYFVMELVHGIPITAYCDQNQLSLRRRLELFLPICAALQHAHQKGIVHRDLKPSNVLVGDVDGMPVAKVIDFGVAKATQGRLTDHTLYTRVEQFIGTPAYMSPEQAEMSGLDVDARSDIYSLGVLLYELLTGRLPFDAGQFATAGVDDIRRRIREEEPLRPSQRVRTLDEAERTAVARRRTTAPAPLIGALKGDLDWIVMRCLEKDRNRRYASAHDLAADLQRQLEDRPVLARPPQVGYRLRKFAWRQRAPLTLASALAVGLAGGLWWWGRSDRRPAAADSAALKARELTDAAFQVCRKLDFTPQDLAVAEDQTRRATELDSASARAWGVRAWIEAAFIFRYWDREEARQQAAQDLANHALSLDPNQPDALLAEAEVLDVRGAYGPAEPLARKALAAAPDDYLTSVQLAEILWGLDRMDEVQQVLQSAIRRSPENVLLRYQLARLEWNYYLAGHAEHYMHDAIDELHEIVRIRAFAGALVAAANAEMSQSGDLKAMRADLDQLERLPLIDRSGDRAVFVAAEGALREHRPDRVPAILELTARAYFEDRVIESPKAWLAAFAEQEAGHPHLAEQHWEEAARILRQRLHDDPSQRELYEAQLADTLAWLDRREEAAAVIAPLASRAQESMTDSRAMELAYYYGAAGDSAHLAVVLRTRMISRWDLLLDPWWDRVRRSVQFEKLLQDK